MFVKICGITTEEDALLAVALGADAIGFNFVPGSSRRITPEEAKAIVGRLPHGVVTVGIFRNERPERVAEVVNTIGLRGAQLNGREPLTEVRWIRTRIPFVIQAFAAGDPAINAAANGPADVVLIDSPEPGSGQVFDWSLAEGASSGVRLLLAGGLNPDNVGAAIERVRPFGVDVATGVESTPGRKDPRKLRLFIQTARAAAARLSAAPGSAPEDGAGDLAVLAESADMWEPDAPHAPEVYDWELEELEGQ